MQKVKIHVKNINGAKLPTKANPKDAAYDVYATSGPVIAGKEIGGGLYEEIDYIEYGTNLFVEPQPSYKVIQTDIEKISEYEYSGNQILQHEGDWWLQGLPRSSISKYNLLMANSCPTVDNPYRGEIKIRFKYQVQMNDITIFEGNRLAARVNFEKCYKINDRICQLRPVKNVDVDWILVDELGRTQRNEGGFGSSGN